MLDKLLRLFFGLFTIVTISSGVHSTAQAQTENFVSYRCDLNQDHIIITYNHGLPGDELGVNSWGMDSLWGPVYDEDFRVPMPVTETCRLNSGTFEVKITPEGNPDIQGMCGDAPSTARVDITFNGNVFFNTDFNDEQCGQNDSDKIIDKIEIVGKTKKISISFVHDAS
jgi:hypothetical protein